MASMFHLDSVEAATRARLVAATTELNGRAGLPATAPELSKDPLPSPKSNSHLRLMADLAEATLRLANELDDVRSQLAGTQKGEKRR